MSVHWRRLEDLAAGMPEAGTFSPGDLAGLPDPAARYLGASIAPGTVLAPGARVTMRGSIKVGRWLPFRARQLLVPRLGTVWEARVAGVLRGSDRYVDGRGGMDWTLFGLARVIHVEGEDVSRSTANRAASESFWVPTAVARPADAVWSSPGPDRVAVELETDGHPAVLEHEVDSTGRLLRSRLQRWGDPDETGTWDLHPFGLEVDDCRTFGGVTIPSRGHGGWHHGTDRWEEGTFFRFEITGLELLATS